MVHEFIPRMRNSVRVRTRLTAPRDAWGYRRTFSSDLAEGIARERRSNVCVVVHLYHVDLWPEIFSYLRRLPPSAAEVFVTTPPGHLAAASKAVGADVRARMIATPNRGRDVLPFIQTARLLHAAGYVSVLKVHSKKSVHHPAAAGWLGRLLDQLLPAEEAQVNAVLHALMDERTGVIGPEDSYHAASHMLSENRRLIHRVIDDAYGREAARVIMGNRLSDLGFFAGTMFWARLDALASLLTVPPSSFAYDRGQGDATMAHALERLFTFVPAIDGRAIYTLGPSGLRPLPSQSGTTTLRP